MNARTLGARGALALATTLLATTLAAAPAASVDPVVAEEAADVAITSISPQVLTPDETLTVVARVENTTANDITVPTVRLHVNRFRVVDRAGISGWADLGPQEEAGSIVATTVLDEPIEAGTARNVRFRVPGRELGFLDLPDTWGPRGLAVSVSDGEVPGVIDVDRSFILWLSAPTVPQTRVSVVVPLTGNPVDVPAWTVANGGAEGNGEVADGEEQGGSDGGATAGAGPTGTAGVLGTDAIGPLISAQGRFSDVLAATGSRSHVAFAVDPAVVAASLASTDEAAQAWTAELLGALDGRDVFALGWADPDVAALARGRGTALLEGALELSTARAESLLGRSARLDLAWPAGGLTDAQTLEFVAQSGARAVVAAPGVLTPRDPDPGTSPTGRTTVTTEAGPVVVLLPDAGLVNAFVDPVGSTPATVAQRLLAETAVIAREQSTELRHLVIALPREWHPDPALAGAQLAALENAPWVDPTSVSALLGTLDPRVDRVPLPAQAPARDMLDAETVTTLAERLEFAQAFAPVLTDPDTFLAQQAAQLLAPTAVAWRTDPAGRTDLAARVIEEATARTVGLSVVAGSDVSLISARGEMPVTVSNALADDARVVVELRPHSGVLVADETVEALVPAGEQTTVRVPVQSVANGDVTIEVVLLSPEGRPVAPPSSFEVRVRADWESVGTWVIAALLGVGFVAGIVRTVRRGKTSTRVDAADVPELARETGE